MHTQLLKSQKNDTFLIVTDAGLNPTEFEWSEVDTRWKNNGEIPVAQLTHSPTGYYFSFDRYKDSANPRYFPGESVAAEVDCGQMDDWQNVAQHLKVWVSVVRREYLEPDFWHLSKSDKRLVVTQIDDIENVPFTLAEQERLSGAINEIREYLLTSFEHTTAQRQFIEARLQHLEDASKRLGRKDWITLAMGTFTNIVVGVALAPEAARELLRTAGALLGWVVGSASLIP